MVIVHIYFNSPQPSAHKKNMEKCVCIQKWHKKHKNENFNKIQFPWNVFVILNETFQSNSKINCRTFSIKTPIQIYAKQVFRCYKTIQLFFWLTKGYISHLIFNVATNSISKSFVKKSSSNDKEKNWISYNTLTKTSVSFSNSFLKKEISRKLESNFQHSVPYCRN